MGSRRTARRAERRLERDRIDHQVRVPGQGADETADEAEPSPSGLRSRVVTGRRTIAFVRRRVSESIDDGVPVIFLIGRDGRGLQRLTRGTSPSWSPDGRRLVFAWGNAIYRIDADGGARTRLARGLGGRGSGLYPRWSPDGRKILYVTRAGIWTMNADGSERLRILRREGITGAAWQPG